MAPWTEWVPLISADPLPSPGVYLARQGAGGPVVYVGVGAGARQGGGLRGRLRRYTSGKALASGLGEGIFDRALADREWLRERLAEVESGRPMRAVEWGRAALVWANLHVCWALTDDRVEALSLERRVLAVQGAEWWNRAGHGGH
ncbi:MULTISPECIES: hypothetical protein [unclassified Streptomyces]|uniref:hypothetical protein n=1 Tax=unclassified Streptomyces TaxID=2593676 RepID=UPI000B810787|nr:MULTISPECIES: hypothetical protein [unclassified Streptomyces]MYR92347.1 hypothetical protein [Streptomyces sp. SID4937]